MKKKANINELVWAKKDGYAKRQFTLQQLEAMGTDTPNGDSYDGWKVVAEAVEPSEAKEAKAKAAAEAKALKEKEAADKKAAELALKEKEAADAAELKAQEEANKQNNPQS